MAVDRPVGVVAADSRSYGDGQPQWARVLRSLYAADFLDWRTWGDMFERWGLRDPELAETVEWMEERGMPGPETAKALRGAAYARRDMQRRAAGSYVRTRCARCGGSGFFSYWPQTDFGSARFGEAADPLEEVLRATMTDYRASIICQCDVGKALLAKSPYYSRFMPPDLVSALVEESRRAAKQADYVAQQLARWSARYPKGSKRERVTIQGIGFKFNGGQ